MSIIMPGWYDAIVCAQWGDTGKGKLATYLAQFYDWVLSLNGANNAGHTGVIGDKKYHLHFFPTPVIFERLKVVLGLGMLLEPWAFLNEMQYLAENGISTEDRIYLDARIPLILITHRVRDVIVDVMKAQEGQVIGTTGKGAGPGYTQRTSRRGVISVADFHNEKQLVTKITEQIEEELSLLARFHEN